MKSHMTTSNADLSISKPKPRLECSTLVESTYKKPNT
jgi:hypothetical protein